MPNKAQFLKMMSERSNNFAIDAHGFHRSDKPDREETMADYQAGFLAASKWWAAKLLYAIAAPDAMDFKHRLDELKELAEELLEDEK